MQALDDESRRARGIHVDRDRDLRGARPGQCSACLGLRGLRRAAGGPVHGLLALRYRAPVTPPGRPNSAGQVVDGAFQQGGVGEPLHELCLFKLGIPLGEIWWLTDLANHLRARKRNRFLLTAPPLRLPGAVGSPVTPVATV